MANSSPDGIIKVQINPNVCEGFGYCAESCPTAAIYPDPNNVGKYTVNLAGCIGCFICEYDCPVPGAIYRVQT